MLRTFLAIELPTAIHKRLEEIQRELKESEADVRWVDPKKIHLTLKFFGYIEEKDIEPIVESIGKSLQKISPFFLRVKGIGGFPNLKNPRILWVGLEDSSGILSSLQIQLEEEFERIGFRHEDRPFHPHLTLGRMKSNRGRNELIEKMERLKGKDFGKFQVEKVILYKSDLRPTGPLYTPLKEVRLEGFVGSSDPHS
ncbi:MAG: RNA 2',3'-cyclic phosphodiesterase [Thermodesulfobacteriota bacterium]